MTFEVYWPRQVRTDPRQMPELRMAFQYLARDGGPWHQAEDWRTYNDMVGNFKGVSADVLQVVDRSTHEVASEDWAAGVIAGPTGYGPGEMVEALKSAHMRAANGMRWYQTAIERAQLIHISSELCDVLFSAHDTVPEDTVLHEADAPTPWGLVVFSEPFLGIDSGTTFKEVRVDGIMWGPVSLPPRDNWMTSTGSVIPGFAIAAFRYMDPLTHDDPAADALRAQLEHEGELGDGVRWQPAWIPLGRADWILGEPITTTTHDGISADSETHLSMMEDRKLVAALWSIIKEKRMVERVTVTPNRPARRRLERAGYRESAEVQVVHLRRPEYRPRNEDGSDTRRIGVRFAVRPHWRNQAYGPGRKLRKLILVPPHIRGPEDAPFKHAERIWSVDT